MKPTDRMLLQLLSAAINAQNPTLDRALSDSEWNLVYGQAVDDFMDFMRSINQGEKIFCRYPGGTLYTADEIDSLMFEQYLKENHMTLEDYHASQEAFRAKHGYPGYY